MRLVFAVKQIGRNHAPIGNQQPDHRGPFGKLNALVGARKSHQRPADLRPGRVAVGMQNARQRVGALAGAQELASFSIELRAPLDELGHAHGPLGHQRLCRGHVDKAIAGRHGVFQMERHILIALHGYGDPALRVVGVRFAQTTPW